MTDEEVIDVEVLDDARHLPAVRASEAVVARGEISVEELLGQRDKIVQAMERAMRKDVHYGTIPGISKPTLLKPGAELLNVLFRFAPSYHSERTWHDDGHLTVVSRCTLTHIPTSLVIGEGEGLCSTRESKYAYRQGGRICPECGQAAIIKGKAEYGGGWLCFARKGGCNTKWADGSEQAHLFETMDTGRTENPDIADSYNCITPETRVLTKDLCWVEAGDLVTGDVLIGVNEELPNRNGRRYEESIVTVGDRFTDDLYEVRLEDGRSVRCNGEHRWLTKSVGFGVRWATTKEIHDDMAVNDSGKRTVSGRPRKWSIMTIGSPWETDGSHDGGYMAGLLDGEGCLSLATTSTYTAVNILFAQQEGGVLTRYLSGLRTHGFLHKMYAHGNKLMRKPVQSIVLAGGFLEVMRLLGTFRPPRLLEKWVEFDIGVRRFEGRPVLVESVSAVGSGELVRLGTSSHTYIAEGLVCHNTVLKMADKRALVAAILNCTAASDVFTQDVEDDGGGAPARQSAPAPEQRAFDPETDLMPGAIEGKDASARLFAALKGFDPSVDWPETISAVVQSKYGKNSARELRGETYSDFMRRLSNAVQWITNHSPAGDFPPVEEAKLTEGFAYAFSGLAPAIRYQETEAPFSSEQAAQIEAALAEDDDIPFGESHTYEREE